MVSATRVLDWAAIVTVLMMLAAAQPHTTAGAPAASMRQQSRRGKSSKPPGKERVYYIAAEEVLWDYAPSGRDLFMGQNFTASMGESMHADGGEGHIHHHSAAMWMEQTQTRIGRRYHKVRYVAYTDSTFEHKKPVEEDWVHLGMLGPVIRAEVDDRIKVVFRNNAGFPASIHPHGLHYDKANEGAQYNDSSAPTAGNAVQPGGTFTYYWGVPERCGPGPADPSSVVYVYHSHADEPRDVNSGLFGVIIVTARGMGKEDGSPSDVDRELVLGLFIIDEGMSWLFDRNLQEFLNTSAVDVGELLGDPHFQMSNRMYTVNGLVFGNARGFRMRQWERVRWYMVVMGNENDIHTPHWHGNTLLHNGHRVDVLQFMPAMTGSADMTPDNAGIWMVQCHVHHHVHGGMYTSYHVLPAPPPTLRHANGGGVTADMSGRYDDGDGGEESHQHHRGASHHSVTSASGGIGLAVCCVFVVAVALAVAYRRSRKGIKVSVYNKVAPSAERP